MSRIILLCVVCSWSVAQAASIEAPVVGGTRVPVGKWRDVVLVVARDATCTGTLIAPDIVLTAGHCIEHEPLEVFTDTVDYGKPGGDRIKVKWSRAYPNWERRYDVGVLMLEHVARGKPRAIAAACAARQLVADGAVHVVGFGLATASGLDHNTELREANLTVVDPDCTTSEACEPSIAPRGEFVAGGHGTDTCFGDSGGPVYLDTAGGPALIGVVSRGLGAPGKPCGSEGIYVRADKVVTWIQSVTNTKLQRSTCDGPADGEDAADGDVGGCDAGPGAGIGAGLAALVFAWRRRGRRVRAATP